MTVVTSDRSSEIRRQKKFMRSYDQESSIHSICSSDCSSVICSSDCPTDCAVCVLDDTGAPTCTECESGYLNDGACTGDIIYFDVSNLKQ